MLKTANLSAFYGKIQALFDVSVEIQEGSIVTVIGPNGAGKTTLLNAIMGLASSRGTIHYAGRPVAGIEVEERVGLGLCLVPERRELFSTMSVRDNLILGGYLQPRSGKNRSLDDLDAVFDRFPRLKERSHQTAATLSGGERQMLALGRALMSRPKLLLLDEPSMGLAPLIVREILDIVVKLRQLGVSIFLVEQNARAALHIADYGYVLENGAITLEGNAKDLIHNRRVIETYLGLRQAS
ncbi:MAG TPA: ABC transporter ATP-binding protein [Stellaceae bacterium]